MALAWAKRKVLVVEDEAVTRVAAVEMLREAGFEVLEAGDGTAAFDILHEVEGICAVLTDIDMPPGLDGIRLAACIHRRWPEIGLIVTSGKVRPRRGDLPDHVLYFAKPYCEQAVTAAMHRVAVQSERVEA